MIHILTRPPTPGITFLKEIAAELIKKNRGPRAVVASLSRGLQTLHVEHLVNSYSPTGMVHVASGHETLRYALHKKSKGIIQTVIAGPAISVGPYDHNAILLSPEIDMLLFPSQWTKDFFVHFEPSLNDKIVVWPAGTNIPNQTSTRKNKKVLLYIKNKDDACEHALVQACEKKGYTVSKLYYGTFSQKDYFDQLLQSDFMIYMSYSESQGIALQEAWARNVPTLVYNRGYWKNDTYTWKDEKISAPYLEPIAGSFFKPTDDITQSIHTFIEALSTFDPKSLALRLSDVECAKKYVDIIKKYHAE